MSFIGSAESWGDQACARLCQVALNSNDGMAQQIQEGRTELLDLLPLRELEKADDLGIKLPYLAIFYDRPEMLVYLYKRGVDLTKPCDAMDFGTPMFYAVNFNRVRLVETLDSLGVSLNSGCDTLGGMTPYYYGKWTHGHS